MQMQTSLALMYPGVVQRHWHCWSVQVTGGMRLPHTHDSLSCVFLIAIKLTRSNTFNCCETLCYEADVVLLLLFSQLCGRSQQAQPLLRDALILITPSNQTSASSAATEAPC